MTEHKFPLWRLNTLCFVLGLFTMPLYFSMVRTFGTTPGISSARVACIFSLTDAILLPVLRYKGFMDNFGLNVRVMLEGLFFCILGMYIGDRLAATTILDWYLRYVPQRIDPDGRYYGPLLGIPLLIWIAWLDSRLRHAFDLRVGPRDYK